MIARATCARSESLKTNRNLRVATLALTRAAEKRARDGLLSADRHHARGDSGSEIAARALVKAVTPIPRSSLAIRKH